MANQRKMIEYDGNDGSLGKDGNSIKILLVTYNILAPHLSTTTNWDDRKSKLLEELKFYKADIMCLQEVVDKDVAEYFGPQLQKHGYDFRISTETNDVDDDSEKKFQMGCAIFYKISRFQVKNEYKIDFSDAAERFLKEHDLDEHKDALEKAGIGCVLEFLPLKKRITVCIVNVHLSADKDLADVKLLQAYLLLKGLSVIHEANIPIIVAGDFNIIPNSEAYMLIKYRQMPEPEKVKTAAKDDTTPTDMTAAKDGTATTDDQKAATDETVATDGTAATVETVATVEKPATDETEGKDKKLNCEKAKNRLCLLLDVPMAASLESAYSTILMPGSRQGLKECKRMNSETMEPIFTTVSDNSKDTIDYIFYTKEDFTVKGILELIDDVEELPTEVWPSDHIALMAYIQLKKNRKMDSRMEIPENPWAKQEESVPSTSRNVDDQKCETSTIKEAADQEHKTSKDEKPVNEECETSKAAEQERRTSSRKEPVNEEFETSTIKEAAVQESTTFRGVEPVNEKYETSISEEAADQECTTSRGKEAVNEECETATIKEAADQKRETFKDEEPVNEECQCETSTSNEASHQESDPSKNLPDDPWADIDWWYDH